MLNSLHMLKKKKEHSGSFLEIPQSSVTCVFYASVGCIKNESYQQPYFGTVKYYTRLIVFHI